MELANRNLETKANEHEHALVPLREDENIFKKTF